MSLRPLSIYKFFQCGDRLYTSESDDHRRQILTSKVNPHAVRVNPYPAVTTIFVFNLFYLSTNSLLLGVKYVSKHQDLQIFALKLNKYEPFSAT